MDSCDGHMKKEIFGQKGGFLVSTSIVSINIMTTASFLRLLEK